MIRGRGARRTLDEVANGARLLASLPALLRHPITLDEARATLRRRLERREADFLDVARQTIYDVPESPYRSLLRLAGCEYGDLERLVRRDGVEGALSRLHQHGVYLTIEEFKGRRPAVRGSAAVAVDPARLRNPLASSHLLARTSGGRGAGTPVPLDLACLRERAVNTRLTFDARGGNAWLHAGWGMPGGSLSAMLRLRAAGAGPAHWFLQVDPAAPELEPGYRWRARIVRWASLLAAAPLPGPQYVPLDDPLPIAAWMADVLRAGSTPHLHTFVTPAVRLCEAAAGAGIDLRGARFTLGGEPITAARLAPIRRAGAEAGVTYASMEVGGIGYGCLAPEAPDDVHVLHDLVALVQRGPDDPPGLPPRALLVSSLRPTASLILLNVSLGDQAEMVRRACGCPLARLGWATHLHTIRSFEKLTAGGMTFLDADVIGVLEEVLPARFGGGPTDYQLLEEEGDDGAPQVRLLVHPAVGPLDASAVAETFLSAIGNSAANRAMAFQWRGFDLLRVERRAPHVTTTGKILHLHQERGPPARPAD